MKRYTRINRSILLFFSIFLSSVSVANIPKIFNIAGPMIPEEHYMVQNHFDEAIIRQLIDTKQYFILHAPRQTGKTTEIINFVEKLNKEGTYKALYVNVERGQTARGNVKEGMLSILGAFRRSIEKTFDSNDVALPYLNAIIENQKTHHGSLVDFLTFWSKNSDKPIVLFINEIDSLVGDTLISVLRQLREGYSDRPNYFPVSICLVGVRDVKDYRIWSDENQDFIFGGSAFNIKTESLILPDFTPSQVNDLYMQHTQATGQKFEQEAIDHAYYLTQGQPWLVNALARQACFKDITDRKMTITKEIIDESKEKLILRRDTHLDVLISKLGEPRVANIIDAILAGNDRTRDEIRYDDLQYVRDLGLVDVSNPYEFKIANPIYQEVIPRELTYALQRNIRINPIDYIKEDGSLDMSKLMNKFTQFYRENAAIAFNKKIPYQESGPHLVLMAFMQRVINSDGSVSREFPFGQKRLDLLIKWKGKQTIVIETKIKGRISLKKSLKQVVGYMDIRNAAEGHLLTFDKDPNKPWEDKISQSTEKYDNKTIHVWNM